MVLKSWTKEAHELVFGRIGLWFDEKAQTLNWHRGYYYLDEAGQRIEFSGVDFGESQEMQGEMPWADVPPDIQKALTQIDAYTKDQIRIKEGI